MATCEHETPCEAQKAHATAIKWVLSIIVMAGGVGIGFSVDQARAAKRAAEEAKEKASNIAVLENNMNHLQNEVSLINIKLESINEIKVTMAEMAGDMRLTLVKVGQLERGE